MAKQESMRAAEAQLLEMAQRFSSRLQGDESITSDALIEVFDTPISRLSVPCLSHHQRRADPNEDFRIHGVKVSSFNSFAVNNVELGVSAVPLVLLHGYGGAAAYYYRNLVGLHSYFPIIYALDMLGWGLSSRPTFSLCEETVEAAESFFVDSLEAWRAKNDVDKMILAGHSLSGYLSVAYCEKYPERVQRLILISPAGTPEETEEAKAQLQDMIGSSWSRKTVLSIYRVLFHQGRGLGEILRVLPKRFGRARVKKFVESFPAIADEDEKDAASTYLYHNMVLPGSGEYCMNRFLNHFAFAKKPTIHRIPKLQVGHVSFLYGDRDFIDIHAGGLAVQHVCDKQQYPTAPTVTVYKVRNATHLLMWDNWEEFNAGMILAAGGNPHDVLGPEAPTPTKESYQNETATRRQASVPRILHALSVKSERSDSRFSEKD